MGVCPIDFDPNDAYLPAANKLANKPQGREEGVAPFFVLIVLKLNLNRRLTISMEKIMRDRPPPPNLLNKKKFKSATSTPFHHRDPLLVTIDAQLQELQSIESKLSYGKGKKGLFRHFSKNTRLEDIETLKANRKSILEQLINSAKAGEMLEEILPAKILNALSVLLDQANVELENVNATYEARF